MHIFPPGLIPRLLWGLKHDDFCEKLLWGLKEISRNNIVSLIFFYPFLISKIWRLGVLYCFLSSLLFYILILLSLHLCTFEQKYYLSHMTELTLDVKFRCYFIRLHFNFIPFVLIKQLFVPSGILELTFWLYIGSRIS